MYAIIAGAPHLTENLAVFLLVFGISFFFVNFGPNTTTFLIPSEIYPTSIRAKAHGISAAVGKLGAFVGAFLVPILLRGYGLRFTMFIMMLVSFAGIFTTVLIPEMKNVDLETLEVEKKV
jgi:PHS family inorganic phosphate transporter-like MFS transporter